ncbi:MAG: hypothetical protein RL264_3040 [Bacteroidota bacterium]|jgi:hypothetical protein
MKTRKIPAQTLLLLFLFFVYTSCKTPVEKNRKPVPVLTKLDGTYLVDNFFFPQDTLIMTRLSPINVCKKRKLLLQFSNDSLVLRRYNFDPWNGKWFCDFYSAATKFKGNKLRIFAKAESYAWTFEREERITIVYRLKHVSTDSLVFIKLLNTSEKLHNSARMKQLYHEDIWSDIQLK